MPIHRGAGVGLGALLLSGCLTLTGPSDRVLRVAIAPVSPPLCGLKKGKPAGLEVDFARALAGALNREVRFVKTNTDGLLAAVEDGKADVAMSGITANAVRSMRVAFTAPYLQSGQMVLARRSDVERYRDVTEFLYLAFRVAVVRGSAAEAYMHRTFTRTRVHTFREPSEALRALRERDVEAFVHDAPVIVRLAAEVESEGFEAISPLLTSEPLAWAVSRDNDTLREAANRVLEGWRADGSLKRLVTTWIPHYARYQLSIPR